MRDIRRPAAIALASFVALAAVAGCGSDSDKSASKASTSTKKPPVIDVSASGADGHWSFDVPSGGITGGVVTLRLTNNSKSDTHDIQLARIDGTHTKDEILKVVSGEGTPIPAWLHGAGGVATVAPGQSHEATMRLEPGHYVYFCVDDTDGKSHMENGMFGELDVKGDSGAVMPTATAHVVASEYKFTTTGLKAGKNVVEFENGGKELHMVMAAPIAPGKTIDDVKAAFQSEGEPSGPPPMDFEKAVGTEVVDPGGRIVTTWDLQAGKYALICFLNDRAGGPPHFMSGMLQELDVT